MSTARRRRVRRHERAARPRDAREVRLAVLSGLAVVAGTVLGVWLLRPGGLASRQPRAAWFVTFAVVGVAVASVWALRSRPASRRRARAGIGLAAVMIGAIVAWFAWPGGVIKDYPTAPAGDVDLSPILEQTPTVPSPDEVPGSTAAGSTGTATTSPTTTPPTTTDTPATTGGSAP